MSEIDTDSTEFKSLVKAAVAEATEGLIAKRDELLGEVKKLRKGQSVDPAEVEKIEAERDAARAEAAEAKRQVAKAVKDAQTATDALKASDAREQNLLKETALDQALAKAGVTNPFLAKAAKAVLNAQAQVVAEGDARVVKIGDKSAAEAVAAWAGTDEGKHFVTAADTTGSGAQNNGHKANNSQQGDMGGDKAARIARAQALLDQNAA